MLLCSGSEWGPAVSFMAALFKNFLERERAHALASIIFAAVWARCKICDWREAVGFPKQAVIPRRRRLFVMGWGKKKQHVLVHPESSETTQGVQPLVYPRAQARYTLHIPRFPA